MIKKNTKMIFEDGGSTEELAGGIPLSVGEIVHVKKDGESTDYVVADKNVEFIFDGDDQIANIAYSLMKN